MSLFSSKSSVVPIALKIKFQVLVAPGILHEAVLASCSPILPTSVLALTNSISAMIAFFHFLKMKDPFSL